jgi:hypothetical protein
MSWSQSAIDPAKDLTELIEKSQKEHVLAVKDIQRSEGSGDAVDTSSRPISFCLAIVKTDHGNSVYRFWYDEEPSATTIHAVVYDKLIDKLPDDITLLNDQSYRSDAYRIVLNYAFSIKMMPYCGVRSRDWADKLRRKLFDAIPADRPDLRSDAERVLGEEIYVPPTNPKQNCDTKLKQDALAGDQIIAGKRTIWDDYQR